MSAISTIVHREFDGLAGNYRVYYGAAGGRSENPADYGAVADDELALAAAERKERINDDNTGLNRLCHEIPVNDRRRRALDRFQHICGSGPFPIERAAKRIDDTAEQRRSHRHAHHIAGAVHRVASLDRIHIVQQDTADMVAFERLDEAELSFVEAQKLIEPNIGQPGDSP